MQICWIYLVLKIFREKIIVNTMVEYLNNFRTKRSFQNFSKIEIHGKGLLQTLIFFKILKIIVILYT